MRLIRAQGVYYVSSGPLLTYGIKSEIHFWHQFGMTPLLCMPQACLVTMLSTRSSSKLPIKMLGRKQPRGLWLASTQPMAIREGGKCGVRDWRGIWQLMKRKLHRVQKFCSARKTFPVSIGSGSILLLFQHLGEGGVNTSLRRKNLAKSRTTKKQFSVWKGSHFWPKVMGKPHSRFCGRGKTSLSSVGIVGQLCHK